MIDSGLEDDEDVIDRIKQEIAALEARVLSLEEKKSDDSYRKGFQVGYNNGLEQAAIEAQGHDLSSQLLAEKIRAMKV